MDNQISISRAINIQTRYGEVTMVHYSLALSIATVLLLSSAPTFGQDLGDNLVIEEITVTARKRSETLQEVPLLIASVTDG